MKKSIVLLSCAVAFSVIALADSPKRELRASWIATVENIDWQTTKITKTGAEAEQQIAAQKQELIVILDRLAATNMNVACLQIRPMADALYRTEITTWSYYLTSTRGKDPGYDPLRFAIDEAHKRGIELHGWMNPYRYRNSSTPTFPDDDYMKVQHPEWILNMSGSMILDPGLPEVRKHIADVTKEVLVNYPDIDGILWDDYFYISEISSQDNATFLAHNPENLSLADWRRDNVNKTVKEVYDTIQAFNPEILFGISPRGIWSTSREAAAKYGVELPEGITGSDNYNSIYCDALAWLSEGTIDFISPQLYWATTSTGQDYDVLCPWWYGVAKRYGRHFYSSMGLYRGWENDEYKLQIDRNRATDSIAPGAIVFSDKNLAVYGPFLKASCFTSPSLRPLIDWKETKPLLPITDLTLEGDLLKWNHGSAIKFSVYVLPQASTDDLKELEKSSNLLGVTYEKQFNISDYMSLLPTHKFAVCAMDGYARESTPYFYINTTKDIITTSAATELTRSSAKLNGTAMSQSPISFKGFEWKQVGGEYQRIDGMLAGGYLSANLTGLNLLTSYVYRAYMTNADSTAYGKEVTFTTPGFVPPTVTTTTATNVTGTSATLNGTISAGEEAIVSQGFEWKTGTGAFQRIVGTLSGTELSAELSGLNPRTVYEFRAFAETATETTYGETEQFITGSSGEITETLTVDLLWKKTRTDVDYIFTNNQQRCIAYYDGKLYIPRISTAGTFVVVNAANGEKIAQRTVKSFNSEWNMMSVAISDDGQIMFGSSLIATSGLTINVSDRDNGGLKETQSFSMSNFGRCDYFSYYGDFNTEEGGYVLALSNTSRKVAKIPVSNGIFGTPTFLNNSAIPTGLSTKTLALNDSELYLQTSTTVPQRHMFTNGNLIEEFGGVSPVEDPEGTSGMAVFSLKGRKYMVTPASKLGSIDFFDITNGLNVAEKVAQPTADIGTTANTAYTVGICAYADLDTAYVYVLVPNNGLVAYKVHIASTDIQNTTVNNTMILKTDLGARVELNQAALIQVYSINGALVYQKKAYGTVVIPLNQGAYLICVDGQPNKFVK